MRILYINFFKKCAEYKRIRFPLFCACPSAKSHAKTLNLGIPSAACRFGQRSYKTFSLKFLKKAAFPDFRKFPELSQPQTGNFYTNNSLLEALRTNLLIPPLARPFFLGKWKGIRVSSFNDLSSLPPRPLMLEPL